MQAWIMQPDHDAPEMGFLPMPVAGPGQVLVRVRACGLNFADLLMAEGRYQDTPARPYVPGLEFSGEVTALGPGVSGLALGQRVAGFAGQGGLAGFALAPADQLVTLPDSMTHTQAAGFQIAYGTAHLALTQRARIAPGETLVVTGAAGGVGLTAVEIGHRLGARVIAVARGAEKLQQARDAGAQEVLDSDTPDLGHHLKAMGGADVILDPVGGDLFPPCLRALRPLGRYLAIGFASGTVPQVPANHLLVKNLSVIGVYWGGYLKFRPDLLRRSLADLLALHDRRPLALHVSHELPFDQYPAGLALLKDRKSTGKVVITLPQ